LYQTSGSSVFHNTRSAGWAKRPRSAWFRRCRTTRSTRSGRCPRRSTRPAHRRTRRQRTAATPAGRICVTERLATAMRINREQKKHRQTTGVAGGANAVLRCALVVGPMLYERERRVRGDRYGSLRPRSDHDPQRRSAGLRNLARRARKRCRPGGSPAWSCRSVPRRAAQSSGRSRHRSRPARPSIPAA
jgi:hypothetical protein